MAFSTTDSAAFFIFGVSALVGTFGKRLVRTIGLAVMPFAFAGLVLSLNHHGSGPGPGSIFNNAPSISTNNTNNQNARINILNIIGPQRLLFDARSQLSVASRQASAGARRTAQLRLHLASAREADQLSS
jgi:hypothetical protein